MSVPGKSWRFRPPDAVHQDKQTPRRKAFTPVNLFDHNCSSEHYLQDSDPAQKKNRSADNLSVGLMFKTRKRGKTIYF